MEPRSRLNDGLGGRDETGSPPRAFALNRTAATADAEITLLALTVVGRLVRISGLVRFRRSDLRLVRVPDLAISPVAGPRLTPIGAHVQPYGGLTWVSWDFERPVDVLVAYEGHIRQVDLASPADRFEVAREGPWTFTFQLPCRPAPLRPAHARGGRAIGEDA